MRGRAVDMLQFVKLIPMTISTGRKNRKKSVMKSGATMTAAALRWSLAWLTFLGRPNFVPAPILSSLPRISHPGHGDQIGNHPELYGIFRPKKGIAVYYYVPFRSETAELDPISRLEKKLLG